MPERRTSVKRSLDSWRRAMKAFGVYNYRLFFAGQTVSIAGNWMQRVAQSWLVLELTGNGAIVGAVISAQFLPILLLAPVGGGIADRFSKRRILLVTQTLAACSAGTLGLLVLLGVVELWMVILLALGLGVVDSVDNPTRHAFVLELVGPSKLLSALGLNSVLTNLARVVGPAVGGLLIGTMGVGLCFVVNSLSYLGLIFALLAMRVSDMKFADEPPTSERGLLAVWGYVRAKPGLLVPLIMMAVVSLFAYEFEVVLPLLARFTYSGDAGTFGVMFSAVGLGAICGGMFTATQAERPGRSLLVATYLVAFSIALVAIAPSIFTTNLVLVFVGASTAAFFTLANSIVQLNSVQDMRGRVIALRTMAVLGARPLGAPVVGAIGEALGPRWALGVGSVAALSVAVWARFAWREGFTKQ